MDYKTSSLTLIDLFRVESFETSKEFSVWVFFFSLKYSFLKTVFPWLWDIIFFCFILFFVHVFNKYLLSTYYVLDILQGTEVTMVIKNRHVPCPF